MNRGSLAVLIAALFLIAAGLSVMYLGTDGSDAKNEGFTYVRNGDDVTVTGHGALEYDSAWSGLKTLTLNVDGEAASIESWGFNGCDSLEAVTVNGPVGSIGDHAFGYCGSLTTVTVNGSVGSIGWAAFEYCGSLTTVTVNGSVGSIGGVAFEALDCLTTVTVNGPVGSIGGVAFGSCHHLKELTIAGPITSPIGENAFLDCGDLKTVNIACNDPRNIIKGHSDNGAIAYYADTVNHVHRYSATYDWADDGSSCTVNIVCANTSDHNHDENAAVTSSVKVKPTAIAPGTTGYSVSGTYDGFAYSDTKDIQDIPPVTEGTQGDFRWTMDGTSLTVTGHGTLDWDPLWVGLTSLTLVPDGGTGIGVHAFDHCDSLTAVTVNGDVGVIDDNAFYECDSLVTVTVQGSVGGLGHAAFASCDGMTAFTVSGSLGSVGSDAFASCDVLTAFTVQGSVGSIGDAAFFDCDSLTAVTINESVGTIAHLAFWNCRFLTAFTVHGPAENIMSRAFDGCESLSVLNIDGPVGFIGNNLLGSCDSLSVLTVTGPITEIDDNAFDGCTNLKTVNVACNDPLGITKGSEDNGHIAEHADAVNHVHRYSAAYDWADDGSSCAVHIVCANTSDHDHVENAAVTSSVKVPPTETEMGVTEYRVSGTYDGFEYSDTKDIQDIPVRKSNTIIFVAFGAAAALAAAGAAFLYLRRPRE